MSRYIDADELKDTHYNYATGELVPLAWADIENAPSIDIVRCKECKWAEPNREGDYDCRCHIPIFRVIADDYCSMGERRDP